MGSSHLEVNKINIISRTPGMSQGLCSELYLSMSTHNQRCRTGSMITSEVIQILFQEICIHYKIM